MSEQNTVDSILDALQKMSQAKVPVDPKKYLEGAEKLNSLVQSVQEELFEKEQAVAVMRRDLLEEGKTGVYAKMIVEASDEYKGCRILKAKIERVVETIRLAKQHARLTTDIYHSNN